MQMPLFYPFKSAIMWRIQTPHLVQLMNIVSNYIFDCNNRDANRAFVTFRENTAPVATPGLGLLLNVRLRGRPPPTIYAWIWDQWMPYNFVADSFHTKKLCSRLSPREVWFQRWNGRFAFSSPPLGDLGTTYDDHLRFVGKRVGDFLLVLIELFSLGRTAEALQAIIGSKSAISLQREPVDPKFQVEGDVPHQ